MKQTNKVEGELIFGIHPVIEAVKAKKRKIISFYTTKPEPKGWQDIQSAIEGKHIPIQYVDRSVLTRMADSTDHQGVIAWVGKFPFKKNIFEPSKHPLILMLDGIQDPRNVGAIIRSAYCTAFNGIVLIKRGGSPLTATALKSSAGLAEHIDIFMANSVIEAATLLKKAGYTLYMATFDGQNALSVEFQKPLCLVIGGEGVGISRSILKEGLHVTLPQKTADISYNASVAAGLLTFLVATKAGSIK
ncbi:RNA methyltransferase [bacterium]|nr:MAG: RNA methyltransferase [bacterium]QQR61447.1 MAG: RNA methyltransferase [bacterium]QQR63027.1 MAG: RNA methyltransferase [bacterium]